MHFKFLLLLRVLSIFYLKIRIECECEWIAANGFLSLEFQKVL